MRILLPTILIAFLFTTVAVAQPGESVATLHARAKGFLQSGDFDNAVLVLRQALIIAPDELELNKDLVMAYTLKRDYTRARENVISLCDRPNADVVCFQLAGNVFKALEEVKECDKFYKRGLKKFPNSGPLFSEYGELLWSAKDPRAIEMWEKGIEVDPGYGGNYYNAALYYYYTTEKVWGLIYGEIFVNLEGMSERGRSMRELLLKGYKEKLFADNDLSQVAEKTTNPFAKAFLSEMAKHSAITARGIDPETLTMIRTRFLVGWFDGPGKKFPFKLFDVQRQWIQADLFQAYNQWLFLTPETLVRHEQWKKENTETWNKFQQWQQNRVFRIPSGQYYQSPL
ncbi:MAG: tetratricopeptide repeat protein [Bacteroidota bacterium]